MLDWWKRSFQFVEPQGQASVREQPVSEPPVSYWNFERHYINVLRRESANLILDNDLDQFVAAFYEMVRYEEAFEGAGVEALRDEKRRIKDAHSSNFDLDLIGMRHFIKYDRAAGDVNDALAQYRLASKTLILDRLIAGEKRRIYDESEIETFEVAIKSYRAEIFRRELMKAFHAYSVAGRAHQRVADVLRNWQRGQKKRILEPKHDHSGSVISDLLRSMKNYDDPQYCVFEMQAHPNERRYGVHVKKNNEHGVVAETMKSDGRVFRSFYRCNPLYSNDSMVQV